VLERFRDDDDALVRSVLKDLVGSGVLFQTGRGDQLAYRYAQPGELADTGEDARDPSVGLVWVTVYRRAPVSAQELLEAVPVDEDAQLQRALDRLLADGRIERCEIGGQTHYSAQRCMIPVGANDGWEAAVFDHYQAMVTAITTKLRLSGRNSAQGEATGGSTYSCDVWDGHPLKDEVFGFLAECRARGADLVKRVDAYNDTHEQDADSAVRVYAYVGQSVVRHSEEGDDP
jgi:hypothetical protein